MELIKRIPLDELKLLVPLVFPVAAVLLCGASYLAVGRFAFPNVAESTGPLPKAGSSVNVDQFIARLASVQAELARSVKVVNEKFERQLKVEGEKLLSPCACFREKKPKEGVEKPAPKKEKKVLNFNFSLTVEITAVAGRRQFALINGEEFVARRGKVIDCGSNKCYVKVLKVSGTKVKAYVAPANFKKRGIVVWLKRGENAVKLSFSV